MNIVVTNLNIMPMNIDNYIKVNDEELNNYNQNPYNKKNIFFSKIKSYIFNIFYKYLPFQSYFFNYWIQFYFLKRPTLVRQYHVKYHQIYYINNNIFTPAGNIMINAAVPYDWIPSYDDNKNIIWYVKKDDF